MRNGSFCTALAILLICIPSVVFGELDIGQGPSAFQGLFTTGNLMSTGDPEGTGSEGLGQSFLFSEPGPSNDQVDLPQTDHSAFFADQGGDFDPTGNFDIGIHGANEGHHPIRNFFRHVGQALMAPFRNLRALYQNAAWDGNFGIWGKNIGDGPIRWSDEPMYKTLVITDLNNDGNGAVHYGYNSMIERGAQPGFNLFTPSNVMEGINAIVQWGLRMPNREIPELVLMGHGAGGPQGGVSMGSGQRVAGNETALSPLNPMTLQLPEALARFGIRVKKIRILACDAGKGLGGQYTNSPQLLKFLAYTVPGRPQVVGFDNLVWFGGEYPYMRDSGDRLVVQRKPTPWDLQVEGMEQGAEQGQSALGTAMDTVRTLASFLSPN